MNPWRTSTIVRHRQVPGMLAVFSIVLSVSWAMLLGKLLQWRRKKGKQGGSKLLCFSLETIKEQIKDCERTCLVRLSSEKSIYNVMLFICLFTLLAFREEISEKDVILFCFVCVRVCECVCFFIILFCFIFNAGNRQEEFLFYLGFCPRDSEEGLW